MRALPSWIKRFIYGFLCIFTLAQTGFGQGPAAASAYGKLPLSFEPNQEQANGPAAFLARGQGYTLLLNPGATTLALHRPHPPGDHDRREEERGARASTAPPIALQLRLVGANASAQGIAEDALPGKSNYFIGNDRTKWRTDVPNYGRVRYRGVYPGIDLVYYGNQRLLEHDFEVAPGADPRRIRLAFEGIQSAEVEKSGDLVLHLTDGEVRLQKPVIYQNTEAGRREVTGGFVLRKNQVAIQVGAYDRRRALVIDPVLSYSTYLGGSGEDAGSAVATDNSGNVYVVGKTASTAANGFPIKTQVSATGCAAVPPAGCSGALDDVFITKINPAGTGGTTGTALVYSTFLGGNGDDEGYGISVDSGNNAYVTGFTSSTNFPLSTSPAPFQPTIGSFQGNAFVSKINAAGNALLYSTYLGGTARDWGNAITQDSGGNIYVTGNSYSRDFPTLSPLSTPPVTLFASRDSGTSWAAATSGITSFQVTAFAVDRNTPGTVYAGQVGSGVIKSTDFGATWTATTATQSYTNALVLDRTTTGATAVLYEGSRFNGVRKITGGGTANTFINSGLGNTNVLSLVQDATNAGTLYAGTNGSGVWVNTTINTTPAWSQMPTAGLGNTVINALAVDASDNLYAGTNSGVYELAAGTVTWATLPGGPAGFTVLALAVDSSSNVYAATFGGGLLKLSAGAWTALNGSGGTALGTLNLRAVAVDPVTPATIYAAGRSRLGIYKSTDGGSTWSLLNSGLTITSAQTLAIDPASTANVYAGMINLMSFVAKFNSGGLPAMLAHFGGASGSTQAYTIAVDDPTSQDMYIAGSTSTANLPTPLVGQTTIGGNSDGFVAKISTVGTPAVVWDRYLGGAFDDIVYSLALDQNRNVDVTGYTTSANFPVTASAFQSALKGTPNNAANAFVSEIDPTGATLLYSTYFGGTGGDDEGTGIAVVSVGNVASINVTDGGSGYLPSPAAPPAVAISGGGGSGATATAVVSASGQVTGFVITNPGSGYVSAPSVSIALPSTPGTPAFGQAVLSSPPTPLISVAGLTFSTDLPTVNATQSFNAGRYDTFYARFDPSKSGAAGLLYSTYLGGNSDDFAFFVNNLALDSLGAAWITGETFSTNFSTTASNAVQPAGSSTVANSGDAFVYKIQSTGNSSDLRVTMTAPQNVASGASYSYTISVTDGGPSPLGAPNVQVFDQLPSNVNLTATPTATTGSCTPVISTTPIVGARVVCTIGTLAVNGVSQITIPVSATTVAGQSGTTFTNTAIASTSDDDPVPLNNTASVTQTVGIQADLQITNATPSQRSQGFSPGTLGVNVPATDLFNIQNNGPSNVTGAVVIIPVPAGVTFNGSGNGIPCTQSGAIVTCNVGTLTAFTTNVIAFKWTPTSTGTVNITAVISSADADPNLANNAVTWTTIIGPSANVRITGSNPATVLAGSNVTYNVTLTNNGPNSTDVTFGANMPPTFSFVSASWVNSANTTQGACSFSPTANPQLSCSVGTLPYSGTPTTANITIVLRAGNQLGLYTAVGTVTQSVPNPNPDHLSGSATVAVVLTPNAQEALISTDNAHGTLHLFNPATLSEITPAPPPFIASPGRPVVVSPNGRLAYVGTRNARYISVYDLSIKSEIYRIPVPGGAGSVALTADGTTLVTGSGDAVALINTATFAVTTVPLNGLIGDSRTASDIGLRNPVIVGSTVYFNPSGNTTTFPVTPIVVMDLNSHAISTINLGSGAGMATIGGGEDSNLAATPDGRYLVAARTDRLAIIDLANGNAVTSVTDPNVVNTEFALVRGIGDPNVFAYVVTGDITGAADYSVVDLRSGSPSFGQVIGSGGNIILNFLAFQPVLSLDGQTVYSFDFFTNIYKTDRDSLLNSLTTATQAFYMGIDQNSFADGIVDLTPVAGAPTVSSVQPNSMIADTATMVTVTGSSFAPGALVRFGQNPPIAASNVTGTQLQVTVPAGLPVENAMDVVVTNPNSAAPIVQQHLSGVLRGAFTIRAPAGWNPASVLVGVNDGDSTISVIGQQARQIPLVQNGITEAGTLTFASVEVTSDGVFAFTPVTNTFASYITNPNSSSSFGIQITNLANGNQTFTPLDNGLSFSNAVGSAVLSVNPSTQAPVLYVVDVNPNNGFHAQLRSLDANPTSPTFRSALPLNIDAGVRGAAVRQIAVKLGGRYVYADLNTPTSQPPNRRITIFDTLNGSVAGTMDLTLTGLNLSTLPWVYVTPDGNSLLLQTSTSNSIAVFDLSANPASPTQVAGSPIAAVVPNGSASVTFNSYTVANSRLYATGTALDATGSLTQRVLEVFNFVPGATPNFTPIVTFTLPDAASSPVVSSDGSLLYLALQPSNEILVLDVNKVLINDPTAPVTTIRSGYGPARYTLAVNSVAPPVIIKGFGVASIPLHGSTSLSFTIQNNNTMATLTGVGFSDTLPAGLVISTPNGQTGACGGGTITAMQGTNVISLTGATLAQSSSCTFAVNVTGTAAGTQNNTTGNVTSTEGGTGGTASASINVVGPPSIAKAFGASTIPLGGSTSLSFTIQNNNTTATLTGIGFSDTLPAGLAISTPNGQTGACGGGTITATQGTNVISLTGATLAQSSSCTFAVNVTGTAAGTQNNTTGNVTSTEGGTGGTASASITVIAADLSVTMTATPSPVAVLGSVTYQITLTNNGPSPATGVVLTDTLPVGTLFAAINDLTDCAVSSGVLTCNFASLAAASSTTVNLILVPLVVPSGEGTFTNTATVTANEPDPALSNNSATQTVQVTGTNLPGGGALRNLPGFSKTITPPNDDDSFGLVPLGFNLNFFGTPVSSLFVNNNGNVTFGTSLGTFTPFPLTTTNLQIIAPYFSDVETFQTGSGLVTYGNDTVNDRPAFGVNWPNVDYFGEGEPPTLLDLFQLVLVDRSDVNAGDFDIEFNYDKIQWETGSASGGSGGLGGSSARVGYSNGTGSSGSFFELPGSGVPGSFLDSNTATGLIYNTLNSTQPGRYVFQVRGGVVQSSADLAITATGPQFAAPGSTVTYSLTAANLGPNTATGVTVTDTLPVGLTFVSTTQGAICPTPPTPAAGQPVVVTCNVGSIASGSTVDIAIQATITPGVSGLLTDTAVISAPNNQDLNLGNNTATVKTNTNVADLAVSMSPSATQVAPGSNLTYTITVTNNGPSASTGYTLTDTLPTNATFVSATSGCVRSTALTCTGSGLVSGQSANYVVVVTPTAQGTVSNTASVTGTEHDLVPANNSATVTVTAIAVDLGVTMTAAPTIVAPGSNLTYTISVTNNGPSASTGYNLTDTLPSNVTFVSATSGCVLSTVLACTGPSLGAGLTATYVVVVTPTAQATLTNTASVTGNEPDPVPANNSFTLQNFAETADIAVSAAGAPSPVGGFPAFAATVTNNGPADATNVVLTDLLDNYGFISASSTQGSCTFNAPTVTCNLGTMVNGASAVVTVVVTAPNAGWAANTYHAGAAQPDPNPVNNAFRIGPSLDSFNTPVGSNVAINTSDPADNLAASVTFSSVTRLGSTTMTSMSAAGVPAGFRSGRQPIFFDISTNAEFAGAIGLNIHFLPANFRHPALVRLFHFEGGVWVDRTMGLNVSSGVIAGQVMSLSPFALLEPVDTIPVANAGADRSVPGAMAAGARVTLDGSASVDADGDPLTYRWSGPFPEGGGTVTGINPTVTLPLGVSKVSLVVNDGEADSPAVAANIAVADFQVSAPAGSVALNRGQSTSFTITMTPQYGAFGAPINLSCAPGAADVTCSFSSASVTPGATAATATLTVTAASTVARAPGRSMPASFALWFGTLPVFGVVFLGAGRRKKWQMAVMLMLLLVLVASHIGCGGGGTSQTQSSSSSQSTTGAKAITIMVTGTSGTLQHSSSVTVTIPQ